MLTRDLSRTALFIVVVLVGFTSRAAAGLEFAQTVSECVTGQGVVDCTLNPAGRIRIEFHRDDIVRVRISFGQIFWDRPTGALVSGEPDPSASEAIDAGPVVFLVSSKMAVALVKAPVRLVMWRPDGSLVSVDQEHGLAWDRSTGLILTRKVALPGDHYLGLGERGGPIDRRGRRVTMSNVDWAAFTSLTDPLYISIPFFYTFNSGIASGVYVDSGATPFFDIDSAGDGVVSFGVHTGELDYYVLAGPDPTAVARGYRALTGPNQIPPRWSLGYHQSRYSYSSQDEVIFVAWALRQLQIPADVLYFDIDYQDRLQMFTWNPVTFPDPAAMNALLKSWGFRSVNIMEPITRTDDPLYDFLAQSDFYLKGPDARPLVNTIWYGAVSWLDFSKSAVRDWYKTRLQTFLGEYMVDAVWNDLNEPAQSFMPEAVYDFDGQPRTDLEARNLYALLEAKTSFEAQRELRPNERPWVFSRSGFAGLHRYGANWGGDADTSFASLRTNVEMTLSMGLSGQPFFGHDIGGFLGSPSPELFLRWMTFSAYTPLFRNHAMNTSARREPWAFGEPYLSMARNIINERYRLIPYIYSLFYHDAVRSSPVVSPLPFHFPGDETTYWVNDQFLLGESMLVAPITTEGAIGRWVYLPSGATWIDQRTDGVVPGGTWTFVGAGIGEIPVFVRDGAIIPRAPVAASTAAQPADQRSLDIYCGAPASFELYDDDGISLAFEQGRFLTSRISCTPGSSSQISIERTAGTWGPPAGRKWSMHLHRVPKKPGSVSKNVVGLPFVGTEGELTQAAEGWTYTADQRVVVKIDDEAALLVVKVRP